jgi:hypothetical protein
VKAFAGIWIGVACATLCLAPAALATHKLTAKKAEAALKPTADQTAPTVQQKVAAVLPGATVSKTRVVCDVAKNKQKADCSIDYLIAGASTGETSCSQPARVRFRSKKSNELKVSVLPGLACLFVVSLE